MKPLASIIIPTYNRADVLPRAINSALQQSVKNIEVIVVDDASTDNTADVCSTIHDKRLQYIRLDENSGGPATPRNVGVNAANSDVVIQLDSDDALRSQYTKHVLEVFEGNASIGLVWSRRAVIDGATNQLRLIAYVDRCQSSLLPAMLTWTPGTGGLSIRRKVFDDIGGFDSEISRFDDLDFTLRFALYGQWNVRVLDEILLDCYTSAGSMSSLITADYLRALQHFYEKHSGVFQQHKGVASHYLYRLGSVSYKLGMEKQGDTYLKAAIRSDPRNIRYIAFWAARKAHLENLWRFVGGNYHQWAYRQRLKRIRNEKVL